MLVLYMLQTLLKVSKKECEREGESLRTEEETGRERRKELVWEGREGDTKRQ